MLAHDCDRQWCFTIAHALGIEQVRRKGSTPKEKGLQGYRIEAPTSQSTCSGHLRQSTPYKLQSAAQSHVDITCHSSLGLTAWAYKQVWVV